MSATGPMAAEAALALASAGLYGFVGWRLGRRRVAPQSALAGALFSVWWYGLAAASALGGVQRLSAALGPREPAFHATLAYANSLIICVALWALLYFLVYLVTGRADALYPLAALYGAYYLLLVYATTASTPLGAEVGRWRTLLVFQTPIAEPFFTPVLALLVFPEIGVALACLGVLYSRVRDATERLRLATLCLAVTTWFASAALASTQSLAADAGWQWVAAAVGLASPLALLSAYYPPGWIRFRYGVRTLAAAP